MTTFTSEFSTLVRGAEFSVLTLADSCVANISSFIFCNEEMKAKWGGGLLLAPAFVEVEWSLVSALFLVNSEYPFGDTHTLEIKC